MEFLKTVNVTNKRGGITTFVTIGFNESERQTILGILSLSIDNYYDLDEGIIQSTRGDLSHLLNKIKDSPHQESGYMVTLEFLEFFKIGDAIMAITHPNIYEVQVSALPIDIDSFHDDFNKVIRLADKDSNKTK